MTKVCATHTEKNVILYRNEMYNEIYNKKMEGERKKGKKKKKKKKTQYITIS